MTAVPVYTIERFGDRVRVIGPDNRIVKHEVVHSPTGFEYGYGGSGPADLARSILLHEAGQSERLRKVAEASYQDFKWQFIATLDGDVDRHTIARESVRDFLNEGGGE